jgi:hypothetical protein
LWLLCQLLLFGLVLHLFTKSVDIMKLVFSLSLFLLLLADSLGQSTNDILNLLISNKTISQSQADSIRADAALLQQQTDASRKSFFITAARQMQLTGYSQVRYQFLQERGKHNGFDIRRARVDLKGEYIAGKDGKTNRSGWYVQAGYFVIPQKFQVLGKYDIYDPNTSTPNNISTNYVFGANYNFNNWSRLQAYYTVRQEEGPAIKNNFLSVQYQIGF